MALQNLFIRTKRDFAGIKLDAVLSEDYSSPITLTKNPVEFGAEITDHAIIQPKKYTLQGVVSNTPLDIAGALGSIVDSVSGAFGDSSGTNKSRSQSAYEVLQEIKNAREPIEVQTGLGILENMVILDIQVNQTKTTSKAIYFTAPMEEVIITNTQVLTFPASSLAGSTKSQGASPVDLGIQQPQVPSASQGSSILSNLLGF